MLGLSVHELTHGLCGCIAIIAVGVRVHECGGWDGRDRCLGPTALLCVAAPAVANQEQR